MSESKASFIVLALFGLNRAGQVLWGLIAAAGLAYFVVAIQGPPFSDEDERLFRAARHGDRAALEQALAAGAGIEAASPVDGKTALFRAAVLGHPDTVRFLVEHGANPAARGLDGR